MKKILSIMLILAMVLGLAACGSSSSGEPSTEAATEAAVTEDDGEAATDIADSETLKDENNDATIEESTTEAITFDSNVQVGDHITLGTYEQDNDTSDGAEAISWEVLAVENGRALVISDYGLACRPYNEENEDTTWEDCTLRAWLNDEFYNEAFSADEREYILLSNIENNDNFVFGTEGGNDTEDHVFLLSLEEIIEYYNIDAGELGDETSIVEMVQELKARYSQSAVEECHQICINLGWSEADWKGYNSDAATCWWWLRSPGEYSDEAVIVGNDGSLFVYGQYVNTSQGAVRPAMWINLE